MVGIKKMLIVSKHSDAVYKSLEQQYRAFMGVSATQYKTVMGMGDPEMLSERKLADGKDRALAALEAARGAHGLAEPWMAKDETDEAKALEVAAENLLTIFDQEYRRRARRRREMS